MPSSSPEGPAASGFSSQISPDSPALAATDALAPRPPWEDGAALFLIAAGALLRVFQWLGGRSLWLDEIMLSRNVLDRGWTELLGTPLHFNQVAPAGFLALQKLAVTLFGDGELALRAVPLLASFASLFLFWRVARRFLGGWVLVGALGSFAASSALLWYSSEAKQYSTDVAATLAVLLLALRLYDRQGDLRRAAVAAAIGGPLVLLSQPALLSAAGQGIALVLVHLRRRPRSAWGPILIVGAGWGAGALLATALSLRALSPETRDYMQGFWSRSFLPAPWASHDALFWLPRTVRGLLELYLTYWGAEDPIRRGAVVVLGYLAAAGLLVLPFGRRPPGYFLLTVPIVAALAASAAHLLPFRHRVAIWAVPFFLIAAFAVIQALGARLPRFPAAGVALLLGLAVPVLSFALSPRLPWSSEDLRPVLERLVRERREGDVLYVYYGARQALEFYGPRLGLRDWTAGECHRRETRAYFSELDAFRGEPRIWFVWTHAIPRFGEPEAIRSYLSAIGRERARLDAPSGGSGEDGAQALLYDLSDPVPLAKATASSHVIPPPDDPETGPDIGCGGGVLARSPKPAKP